MALILVGVESCRSVRQLEACAHQFLLLSNLCGCDYLQQAHLALVYIYGFQIVRFEEVLLRVFHLLLIELLDGSIGPEAQIFLAVSSGYFPAWQNLFSDLDVLILQYFLICIDAWSEETLQMLPIDCLGRYLIVLNSVLLAQHLVSFCLWPKRMRSPLLCIGGHRNCRHGSLRPLHDDIRGGSGLHILDYFPLDFLQWAVSLNGLTHGLGIDLSVNELIHAAHIMANIRLMRLILLRKDHL